MGRSPFFEKRIKYVPVRETLVTQDFQENDRVMFKNISRPFQHLTLSEPRLERHCSTYGMQEIYLPNEDDIYILTSCENIYFQTTIGTETYTIWYVEKEGPSNMYLCTWVLRDDGIILNAEDLSLRGSVGGIKRLCTKSKPLSIQNSVYK